MQQTMKEFTGTPVLSLKMNYTYYFCVQVHLFESMSNPDSGLGTTISDQDTEVASAYSVSKHIYMLYFLIWGWEKE